MRVLVLGGTRFIGPPAVARLRAAGAQVCCVHRGESDHPALAGVVRIFADRHRLAEQAPALRAFAPDVVLDMLPIGAADSQAVHDVFAGTAGRLVALSSADVYRAFGRINGLEEGPPEPGRLTETAPLRTGRFPYRGRVDRLHDYDKILCEAIVTGDPALPGVVLRLPMVYGPGDYQHRCWPWLQRMDDGRAAIPLRDTFAAWRCSMAFVEDVARAIELAVTHPDARGIYNVAELDAPPVGDHIAQLGAAVGWTGRVVGLPAARNPELLGGTACDAQHVVLDSSRIRRELGYAESRSRSAALVATALWERAHPPAGAPAPDYAAEDALLA